MTETQERQHSYQPMHELALGLASEMGESARQRVDWLLQQDINSFGGLLVEVNAIARGISAEEHDFDGEGIQAGTIGGSIPPDQEDKVVLLDELLHNSQQQAKAQLDRGEDPQTIMHEVAMVLPTVLNKLHIFEDGNGRTSRFMRMMLRDSDQLTPEKTELLISKNSTEKYDTTPAAPVERALMPALRRENGTDKLRLVNDVIDDDEISVVESELEDLQRQFPSLDKSIFKAYEDSFNFAESMRLIAKNDGQVGDISLKGLLYQIAHSPTAQQQFSQIYRGVRRQRVELLIEGLSGRKDIPLSGDNRDKDVKKWTAFARKEKSLQELDPTDIHTIQDFQMAYVESYSPERSAA